VHALFLEQVHDRFGFRTSTQSSSRVITDCNLNTYRSSSYAIVLKLANNDLTLTRARYVSGL
jgi:hypothetical protein